MSGAPGRARTCNVLIRSQMLCLYSDLPFWKTLWDNDLRRFSTRPFRNVCQIVLRIVPLGYGTIRPNAHSLQRLRMTTPPEISDCQVDKWIVLCHSVNHRRKVGGVQ